MLLPLRRTYFGGIAESRNDSSVVVGASEANQSPAQVWRLLLSQRTLYRNDGMVVVTASEAVSRSGMEIASFVKSAPTLLSLQAKQSPAQAWRLLLSQRTLHRNDGMVVVSAGKMKQSPTRISKLFYSMYTINGYSV
jgi:hypothetical protein